MSIATTIISNYGTALYLRDASKLDIIYLSRDTINSISRDRYESLSGALNF